MTEDMSKNTNEGTRIRRRRKKPTSREMWQIFLETTAKDAPVGEILRRHGLYSSDLAKIRRKVESGALQELGKNNYAKKPRNVSHSEHEKVKAELESKEKALAQMSEEYLLLKKRTD